MNNPYVRDLKLLDRDQYASHKVFCDRVRRELKKGLTFAIWAGGGEYIVFPKLGMYIVNWGMRERMYSMYQLSGLFLSLEAPHKVG